VYAGLPKDARYADAPESRWWRERDERISAWSRILKSLGDSYWRQARLKVAASFYEAAIGYRSPYRLESWVDLQALVMLAATFSNLGRHDGVQQLVPAVDQWVENNLKLTQWEREAIRDFYFHSALVYTDARQYATAVQLNLKSLKLDPDFAPVHVNLGYIYMGTLDLPAAIAHFERAVRIDPTHPTANNNLGFTTLIHGDFAKAITYLSKAYERHNYLLVTINLGDAHRYAGNIERALQLHMEALEGIRTRGSDPEYMTRDWRYNYMPLRTGDTETIMNSILVSSKDQKLATVHFALSFDLALNGDFGAAQHSFDTALGLAGSREFRCFFANKIAAIDRFLQAQPRTAQWLDARRLELRRGHACEGS
jgi:tetratricopeptide (TPR) repeat protein